MKSKLVAVVLSAISAIYLTACTAVTTISAGWNESQGANASVNHTINWGGGNDDDDDEGEDDDTDSSFNRALDFFWKLMSPVAQAYASESYDSALWALDFSGTGTQLTGSGTSATLTVYKDSTVLATRSVALTRSGQSLYVTNPAELNSWGAQFINVATRFTYKIDGIPQTYTSDSGSAQMSVRYNGSTLGSSTVAWNRPTGIKFIEP